MNQRVDDTMTTKQRDTAGGLGNAFAALVCGATLMACAGHEASIDPCKSCGGAQSDASSTPVTSDAAGSADANLNDSSAETESGTIGDAGTDANGDLTSDPCPSGPLEFNCSSTCGAGTLGQCAQVSCNPQRTADDPYLAHLTLPAVLRTPEKPGVDPSCARACLSEWPSDTPHRAYAMAFEVRVPIGDSFRIRVDPPWWIEFEGGNMPTFCPLQVGAPNGALAQRCLIDSYVNAILIWTDDPNAPARNIYIDPVAPGVTCN